jgi:hypothetical protein
MKKTNFDRFLAEQLRDPAFVARLEAAGEAWDVSLQLTEMSRQDAKAQILQNETDRV